MPDQPLTLEAARALLYEEARLLDERRFEEWLALFTADAVYWVPSHSVDNPHAAAIIYDDRLTLADRIRRLRSPVTYAQSPPSNTVHAVSNVELRSLSEKEAEVTSVCVIHEARLGQTRVFAARCRHRLRWEEGAGWRIAHKQVLLLDRDHALYNLTFLL